MRGPSLFVRSLILVSALIIIVVSLSDRRDGPPTQSSDTACINCHDQYPADLDTRILPPEHDRLGLASGSPQGEIREGDPGSRAAWEHMMLRDPVTGEIPRDARRRELRHAAGLPVRERNDKMDDWTFRGPHNIGGRMRSVAIDVSDPTYQTLLAGSVSGGLWRTTDDGVNWTLVTSSDQLPNITTLTQDTRVGHEHVWYCGTGEYYGNSASYAGDLFLGDGVFKSVDGGLSWNVLPATVSGTPDLDDSPFDYVFRLAVDASEIVDDEVYAAAGGLILRSIDGGDIWDVVLGDPANPSDTADVIVIDSGVVYAGLGDEGTVTGVHRSPDGITWTKLDTPLIDVHGRIVLKMAPSIQDHVWALVSHVDDSFDSDLLRYIYNSGDGSGAGGTWTDRTNAIRQLPNPYWGTSPYRSYRGYCAAFAVNPTQMNTVYLGGIWLWRNEIGFLSTVSTTMIGGWLYDEHHADQHDIVFQPGSSSVAYTVTDGGVHKTLNINAATVLWSSLNDGLHTTQYFTVGIDDTDVTSAHIVGGTQDNGTHWSDGTDPLADWLEVFGGDGAHCAIADAAAGDYYVSYYRGNIYRLLLGPAGEELAWTRLSPIGGGEYMFINPFIIDPVTRERIYHGSSNGVWRNDDVTAIPMNSDDDTSVNWTHMTNEPAGSYISALGASRFPSGTLYYGTVDGGVYRVDDADTAPAGTLPVDLTLGAGLPAGAYVSEVCVHPYDEAVVLLTFGNYNVDSIWLTRDSGATWTNIEGNLGGGDSPSVRSGVILPTPGLDWFFVGTSTGIYSTARPDGANTIWQHEAFGELGNAIVTDLAGRVEDRLVVAATHGRGMYSVQIPEGTGVTPDAPVRLAQNTPNPFNPSTEIAFRPPRAGRATVDVIDMRGRRVRRLLDDEVGVNEMRVTWDGRDEAGVEASSGVYLYEVRCGDWSAQRTMTLVR